MNNYNKSILIVFTIIFLIFSFQFCIADHHEEINSLDDEEEVNSILRTNPQQVADLMIGINTIANPCSGCSYSGGTLKISGGNTEITDRNGNSFYASEGEISCTDSGCEYINAASEPITNLNGATGDEGTNIDTAEYGNMKINNIENFKCTSNFECTGIATEGFRIELNGKTIQLSPGTEVTLRNSEIKGARVEFDLIGEQQAIVTIGEFKDKNQYRIMTDDTTISPEGSIRISEKSLAMEGNLEYYQSKNRASIKTNGGNADIATGKYNNPYISGDGAVVLFPSSKEKKEITFGENKISSYDTMLLKILDKIVNDPTNQETTSLDENNQNEITSLAEHRFEDENKIAVKKIDFNNLDDTPENNEESIKELITPKLKELANDVIHYSNNEAAQIATAGVIGFGTLSAGQTVTLKKDTDIGFINVDLNPLVEKGKTFALGVDSINLEYQNEFETPTSKYNLGSHATVLLATDGETGYDVGFTLDKKDIGETKSISTLSINHNSIMEETNFILRQQNIINNNIRTEVQAQVTTISEQELIDDITAGISGRVMYQSDDENINAFISGSVSSIGGEPNAQVFAGLEFKF